MLRREVTAGPGLKWYSGLEGTFVYFTEAQVLHALLHQMLAGDINMIFLAQRARIQLPYKQ